MKTIQDLEKEKLQEEINILRARLKTEFPEPLPKSNWKKLTDFFNKWYSLVLALIALAGGFWGIFYPVKTYLNERQKAVQYTINENMIGAMKDLETGDRITRENAIIILTYYDLNAIPILLNKYMVVKIDATDVKQDFIEAINVIYTRQQTGIIDRVIIKMRKNYTLFKEYDALDDWRFNQSSEHLINLIDLIKNMNMVSRDEEKVKEFYADVVADMNKNKNKFKNRGLIEVLKPKLEDFINNGN